MTLSNVDPKLVFAWQAAHSLARGSPSPVHDRGGIRVDTGSEAEVKRWVFPRLCDDLREIAHGITAPRHTLKLCGSDEALRDVLPDRWELQPGNYFMIWARRGGVAYGDAESRDRFRHNRIALAFARGTA